MTHQPSLDAILSQVLRTGQASNRRHLTMEEAASLSQGALEPGARERLLDHVSWCNSCADVLLDLQTPPPDEHEHAPADPWMKLQQALSREFPPQRAAQRLWCDPARWQAQSIRWAVAVPLVACLVLAGVAARLWQHPLVQVVTPTASSDVDLPAQPDAGQGSQTASDPADGSAPVLRAFAGTGRLVLEELFPPEVVRGQTNAAPTLTIDSTVPFFALLLHTGDQRQFLSYRVTVVTREGHVVWQGATRRSGAGPFVLGLPVAAFASGPYRIELFGDRGGRAVRIERYEFGVVVLDRQNGTPPAPP